MFKGFLQNTDHKKIVYFIISIFLSGYSFSQDRFQQYFINQTMRVDFYLAGNNENQQIKWKDIIKEPYWGGTQTNLIDTFYFGGYYFKIFDEETNQLIYSRGFSTLFEEWQTTPEAKEKDKTFKQTIIFPYPKNKILLEIFYRDKKNEFIRLDSMAINPESVKSSKTKILNAKPVDIIINGKPDKKIDIVFLSEGYTENQLKKFINDVKKLTDTMLLIKPYNEYAEYFNIRAVQIPSADSGTDIPSQDILKNTILNTNFGTFGSERYLTTESNFLIRNYAGMVPYDQIYILVNHSNYGGGGIYNHYNTVTTDNISSIFVFFHEFGHGFAALADEYFSSTVAYEDYINLNLEPWQPNITTLVDFDRKWKNLIEEGMPVPTPIKKKYIGKIGVYEGAAYVAKGVYRPYMDCIMKSKTAKMFCPVCQQTIVKTILFNTE
ncbi:MAG: peptidase M64 [Bacteroidales bacterium]|nr:peptidase M64 [Bacteroidales bacterium]